MTLRANAKLIPPLLVAAACMAVPALGQASSGGTGLSSTGGTTPAGDSSQATAQPGDSKVSASGNGITVQTRASGILRRQLHFSGTVASKYAGEIVEIERSGRETGYKWQPTAHNTIATNGAFAVSWHANHIGRFAIRAVIESTFVRTATAGATPAPSSASTSPSLTIIVYRPSVATLYGPGFWGRRTACGERLTRSTIGVANRTLKCGTKVSIYYKDKTLVVPVIDRGPYANGADWDLTMSTAKALGINETATIGAVSLPRR